MQLLFINFTNQSLSYLKNGWSQHFVRTEVLLHLRPNNRTLWKSFHSLFVRIQTRTPFQHFSTQTPLITSIRTTHVHVSARYSMPKQPYGQELPRGWCMEDV